MSGFLKCLLFVALLGVVAFPAGRALPRSMFRYDAFPYRPFPYEDNGNVYRKIGIHRWHNRVPDMSQIFKNSMPSKRIEPGLTAERAEVMVIETCIAESVHLALCVAGLFCLWLWPGWGGIAFYLVYAGLGNAPFILIQRFNRPKLRLLLDKCRRREGRAPA